MADGSEPPAGPAEEVPVGDGPTSSPGASEDAEDVANMATVAPGEIPPDQDPGSLIGKVLDERYMVLSTLGEGGMGAVYLVEHTTINKKFALKVLHEDLSAKADLQERFLREARATAKVGHPNIVDITDFGTTPDGAAFFTMEHLDGQELAQVIRREGPISWRRARPIMAQICRALAAAHAKEVIHRDIKPGNIFLVKREGTNDFVKVLDFGLACIEEEDTNQRLTKTGMFFGSPFYMAPEQVNPKDVDHRADIYALGVVLYEMASGKLPFKGDSPAEVLSQQLMDQPAPMRDTAQNVILPPGLEEVIMKAMARAPEERYQTVEELLQAVMELPDLPEPKPSGVRNVMAILGVVVLLAALGAAVLLSRDEPRERPPVAAPRPTPPPAKAPPAPPVKAPAVEVKAPEMKVEVKAPEMKVEDRAESAAKKKKKKKKRRKRRRRKKKTKRTKQTEQPKPPPKPKPSGELVNPFD